MTMPVKINCQAIPKVEIDVLAPVILSAMDRFYSDPARVRDFEAWKKNKSKEVKKHGFHHDH